MVGVADGRIDASAQDAIPSFVLTARSQKVGAAEIEFELGHCGLLSPIDVDGSLWDPVGLVDGDHPAAINSAQGRLMFTSATTAHFRIADGFTVNLVRRVGPKPYPLCD
jgi:hypothetical protein